MTQEHHSPEPAAGRVWGPVVAWALALAVLGCAVTFVADVTTIRADPATSQGDFASTHSAFPGELISVRLASDWTQIVSSNPEVVRPIDTNPARGHFIAVWPGQAILYALSGPRCPRCDEADVLWRMTVNGRLIGV
jgi:hypothetical protein